MAALPVLLFAILLLLRPSLAQQQQNIRTYFPSIPSPAFLNPPPPPPPPPTPPSSSPTSPPSSPSSRHDVTVAVVSTAFSSFALSALFFFLFLHFTSSKRTASPHPIPSSSASDHKANPRLQPLPQEAKLKHDIVDESGLDAIYWREFEKENGYRPPSDRFSGRTPASSAQSPSRPPSAEGRLNASAIGTDNGEEQDRKRAGWLRKKKKDQEPLIPPGSLDSTSSVFYDSVGSSTSFDSFPPQTAGYDMSPLAPHSVSDEFVKEVHTVGTSGARPGNAQLRPPPGRHHSAAGKPPLHPTASHLSPPTLLQPQLPLPPSRLSSSSKPAVVSADSESIESSSNPFLPPPPGRQMAAASQEPLITIESIPAPDSSPPHEASGSSPLKFTTVPGPPVAPPPPRASSPSPPPPPPPAGRGGPPPPPPPGGRGGPPPPPPPGGRGGPPPPPPPGGRGGPPPPPPPGGRGRGGPPPPPGGRGGAPSLRPPASPGHPSGPTGPRMKPLHWDVMRKLNPDHSMVWDRFKEGGSFRFDEESMEALFGATAAPSRLKPTEATESNASAPAVLPQIILLEPRKSQNIAIVLRSLSCTRQDILDALLEGHGDLSIDTLEKLSKLGLAKEEKELIRDFDGDPSRLSYAESFLFDLLRSVPNAFERVEALLFRSTYAHEVANVRQSLQVLEHACKELRGSALFFKLLEAVLKAGNRMNAGTARGNAQAFNLASLHKLSDVKATDGSTTLLHFIVEEVVRAEGKRSAINSSFGLRRTPSIASNKSGEDSSAAAAAREERHLEYMQLGLPIVARISSEMASVKRAAGIDYDTLVAVCPSLEGRLSKIKRFLNSSVGDAFAKEIQGFVNEAEQEISSVKIEQDRVLELVKRTTEYYHSGASKDRNAAPLQLFVIVKDFLAMVDKACVDITKKQQQQQHQLQKKLAAAGGTSADDGGGSRSGRKDSLDSSVKKDSAERSGRRGENTTDGDGRRIMPRFPNLPPNFMSENRESDSSSDED